MIVLGSVACVLVLGFYAIRYLVTQKQSMSDPMVHSIYTALACFVGVGMWMCKWVFVPPPSSGEDMFIHLATLLLVAGFVAGFAFVLTWWGIWVCMCLYKRKKRKSDCSELSPSRMLGWAMGIGVVMLFYPFLFLRVIFNIPIPNALAKVATVFPFAALLIACGLLAKGFKSRTNKEQMQQTMCGAFLLLVGILNGFLIFGLYTR